MLAQRIVVITSDRAFEQRAVPALRTVAESVDVCSPRGYDAGTDADELQASLCVLHLAGELAGASAADILRLLEPVGDCPVFAVLPRAGLAAAVELMAAVDGVAGAILDEGFDAGALAAMAARIMVADGFGLAHALPGAQIHERSAGSYREKTACLTAIADFVERAGASSKHRTSIEQCCDEMLMNALYDAPVDAHGAHVFAGVPTKLRIRERTAHRVAVQYAADGRRVAVAVRDAFGSLGRATVLQHLHRGLHAEHPVDRKAGGAGLGLYLMATAATAVYFHVLPGIATEVTCVFDLEAPQLALAQFGFAVQRDAAGRVASGPARRIEAGSSRRIWIAAAAIAAAGGAAAVVAAWPRWFGGREAVAPPPVARVELDSRPQGAAVAIDGAPAGSTPLVLTTLVPGATVSVRFELAGYRAATAPLQVPAAGDVKRLLQPLELSSDFVRVRFVSEPPGAEIVQSGRPATADRTYTPAEIFVEAGVVQRFTLTMPKHQPLVIAPFTPERGAGPLEKGGALKPR